jgi:hypothetical protein
MMEQSRDRVIAQIASSGLSEQEAGELVKEAWGAGRGDRRDEGTAEISRGVGLIVLGILATLFFSALLRPVGVGLLFWGAMLYGIFSVISGVKKKMS